MKQRTGKKLQIVLVILSLGLLAGWTPRGSAQATGAVQAAQNGSEHPFVIEYYYKTKWGYADEFLKLLKKNHYPVLKKEIELGRIL